MKSNLGDAATAFVWGGGELADELAGRARRGRVQPDASDERRDADDQRRAGLLDPAPGRDVDAAVPCATAIRWSCAGTATRTASPRSSPRPARTSSTRTSTPARSTARSYKPQRVDFTPDVTQTALGKGFAGGIDRAALPDGALARADGAPRAQARAASAARPACCCGRSNRRPRPRRLAPRRPHRDLDEPGVPVDGELFSAVTIGAPIGLGVYLAWVRRDWSARTKAIGFAAAVGGALVGGVARVRRRGRHAGADHDDRRCRRRLEPRADPARHRVGPAALRPLRSRRRDGAVRGGTPPSADPSPAGGLTPGPRAFARGARRRPHAAADYRTRRAPMNIRAVCEGEFTLPFPSRRR